MFRVQQLLVLGEAPMAKPRPGAHAGSPRPAGSRESGCRPLRWGAVRQPLQHNGGLQAGEGRVVSWMAKNEKTRMGGLTDKHLGEESVNQSPQKQPEKVPREDKAWRSETWRGPQMCLLGPVLLLSNIQRRV